MLNVSLYVSFCFKKKIPMRECDATTWAVSHTAYLCTDFQCVGLTEPAEFRALKVPGLRTENGQKMQCETMDTSRPNWAPSWLRSERGGALSAAFQFGKYNCVI